MPIRIQLIWCILKMPKITYMYPETVLFLVPRPQDLLHGPQADQVRLPP
jgi:hypothetical protein